ncbi:MAG: riboflavin biosynthesis protein RibF [Huintestinicola sp.]
MIKLYLSDKAAERTVVAMGIFDGLHRGHASVIGKAVSIAFDENMAPAVFTFNTGGITTKGLDFKPIYSDDSKEKLLESKGVKYILSPEFEDIRSYSAERFVKEILIGVMNAKIAVCGRDFRLGRGAECGIEQLEKLCSDCGIRLVTVDEVDDSDGRKISSADIRRLITDGDITRANKLLGHDYAICGTVVHGKKLGRTMNFPTANQLMDEEIILPKFGVYASYCELNGNVYRGVTNIGVKPTVSDSSVPLAETFFCGFSGDLYGKDITVRLLEFTRPEMKFGSIEELRNRIALDTAAVINMKYPFETI